MLPNDPCAAPARGGPPLPAAGHEPGYDAGYDPAYPAASSAAFRSGPAFVRRTVVSPETLCCLGDGEFALVVRAPRRRFVPLGKTVPARLDAPPRRRPPASGAAHVPATGAAAQGPSHPRQPFGSVTGRPGPAGDPHAADASRLPMDARGAAEERRPVPRHASLTGAVHGESLEQRRWPK